MGRKIELFPQAVLRRTAKPKEKNPPQGPPLTQAQKDYRAFLRSAEWQETRRRILARDPICAVCHRRRSKHVHHKRYCSVGYLVDDQDLISVCGWCHKILHARRNSRVTIIPQRSFGSSDARTRTGYCVPAKASDADGERFKRRNASPGAKVLPKVLLGNNTNREYGQCCSLRQIVTWRSINCGVSAPGLSSTRSTYGQSRSKISFQHGQHPTAQEVALSVFAASRSRN
jgi:hypothetical protein